MSFLLPPAIDNDYRGHKLALWLFGILLFMKTGMSVSSMFNGYTTLTKADGIPLDTYPAAAVKTILTLWGIYGLAHFVFCVLGVIVLVRYRSAVPLMYVTLLFEFLSRKLLMYFLPIGRVGAPPGPIINLVLLTLMIVGLALSLWRRR